MLNGKNKIILIAALCVSAVILIYFYVSSGDDHNGSSDPGNTDSKVTPLTKDKLQSDVDSILYTFGIKKEWIKESKPKEKDLKNSRDQLLISYDVKIPSDLLTIDLNYEITDHLRKNNLQTKVTEDPKSRNIVMNILSDSGKADKTIGYLKFIYSDSVKRNAADVCLVLDSIDEYSLDDVENILNSTQEFSVFLPLRNDKADYQSKVIELKKDYLLNFSIGKEDDVESDFKDNMKENVWKSKVRTAAINFPGVTAIILFDRGSDPVFYNSVKEEFVRYNISVYPDTVFTRFKTSENIVNSLFEDIILKNRNAKRYLIYDLNFDPEGFNSFDKQVNVMKKLGYRFFDFKELMNKMNKGSAN